MDARPMVKAQCDNVTTATGTLLARKIARGEQGVSNEDYEQLPDRDRRPSEAQKAK